MDSKVFYGVVSWCLWFALEDFSIKNVKQIRMYICISLISINKFWKDIQKVKILTLMVVILFCFILFLVKGWGNGERKDGGKFSKVCLCIHFFNVFLLNKVNIFTIRKLLQSWTDQEWENKINL